jgi:hypothetical protein
VVNLDGRPVYSGVIVGDPPVPFPIHVPGGTPIWTMLPQPDMIDLDITLYLFGDPMYGTQDEVDRACNSAAYGNRVGALSPGAHSVQILNDHGALLAQGSYVVEAP